MHQMGGGSAVCSQTQASEGRCRCSWAPQVWEGEMGDSSSSCEIQFPLLPPVPVVTGRRVVVGGDGVPLSSFHPPTPAPWVQLLPPGGPGRALPKAIFSTPWPGTKLSRTAGGWEMQGALARLRLPEGTGPRAPATLCLLLGWRVYGRLALDSFGWRGVGGPFPQGPP